MIAPRERLQAAIDRSGLSLRKLAKVYDGAVDHTQISRFLHGRLWQPEWATDAVLLAEQVADLIASGVIAASDPVERIRQAVEADRQQTAAAFDALRLLAQQKF